MATALKTLLNRGPAYVAKGGGFTSSGGLGYGNNMEAQLRSMTSVGTLFAIVDRLSEATAAVKWGLYRGETLVTNHIAAQIWANPNPFMENTEFVQICQQHAELTGEMDWFVSWPTGHRMQVPLELWPVRPDRVRPLPDADKFLAGWEYRNGSTIDLWRVNQIIQVKRAPNPMDIYRGLSPVAAALADVYGEQAAGQYNNAFFRNDASPGGVVEIDRNMSDSEWEEFKERWREDHQGTSNSHRTAFLFKGMKWVENKFSMRDMQFEALRKLNREFIREAFGFPKSMLGDAEDVNKANAQAAAWVFKDWLIQPRAEKIKDVLNTKFLPMFGAMADGLEFRYGEKGDNKLTEDDRELQITQQDSDANRAKILVDAGYDPDEVARFCNLPLTFIGKPEPPAPSLPAPDEEDDEEEDEPAVAAMVRRRGGRTPRAHDMAAKALWERGEKLRREHPMMTVDQLVVHLGIDRATYFRYQNSFA